MPTPTLKTLPFSCAAQIASDIRNACKPDFVPARIDRTLEATIDAVLAIERAKVAALVKILEHDINMINQLSGMVNDFAARLKLGRKVNADDFSEKARSALFALQA